MAPDAYAPDQVIARPSMTGDALVAIALDDDVFVSVKVVPAVPSIENCSTGVPGKNASQLSPAVALSRYAMLMEPTIIEPVVAVFTY